MDSDSYVFISSLYDEGGSNRMSLPSTENHMKFSAVSLLCPVESPPFPFSGNNLLKLPLTIPFLFYGTSLLLEKAPLSPQPMAHPILTDIPMQSPLTPVSSGMILPNAISLHRFVFRNPFSSDFFAASLLLKIVCFCYVLMLPRFPIFVNTIFRFFSNYFSFN